MEMKDFPALAAAIEAILFASGESFPLSRLSQVLGASEEDILEAASALADDCANRRRGIRLVRMGDRLQLCSAPEYSDDIARALEKRRAPRLSQPALEVLAIVAYYQPVTRAYIDQVRGVDSSYTVSSLVSRELIEPCGHLDVPGRPTLFRTGEAFLRAMGIKSLDELPPLPDLSAGGELEKLQAALRERESGGQMEMGL